MEKTVCELQRQLLPQLRRENGQGGIKYEHLRVNTEDDCSRARGL